MIYKRPANIRLAYGLALEDADLSGAVHNISELLDDGYKELFVEYYPSKRAFELFVERFRVTRFSLMEKLEWTVDGDLLNIDPKHDQSLKDYFDSVFRNAILNPERGD